MCVTKIRNQAKNTRTAGTDTGVNPPGHAWILLQVAHNATRLQGSQPESNQVRKLQESCLQQNKTGGMSAECTEGRFQ